MSDIPALGEPGSRRSDEEPVVEDGNEQNVAPAEQQVTGESDAVLAKSTEQAEAVNASNEESSAAVTAGNERQQHEHTDNGDSNLHVADAVDTLEPEATADMSAADAPEDAVHKVEQMTQPVAVTAADEQQHVPQQEGEQHVMAREQQQDIQDRQQHRQHHQQIHTAQDQPAVTTAGTSRCVTNKGLTFSGPPYVPKAKPYRRVDYSHSANDLLKIAHDNQLLVQHLTSITKAAPSWSKDMKAPPAPGTTASSAINRRKQAGVIAQENHALYQRLVAIRPSKAISRDTLEMEHRQNETYRINCAQFKPSSSPTHKVAAS